MKIRKVFMNLQGFTFTEQEAREHYGSRFESAILAKAIIDHNGNVIGSWEDSIESLPAELKAQVNAGRATYRGCGLKYPDLTKVKFGKKEYIISNAQFDALGGISKMRFAAPTRRG
jgi:hypothetical protein